jgi:D-alanyl-D-alanine carboxypeptidase
MFGQGNSARPGKEPKVLLETALQEHVVMGCPGAILEVRSPSLGFAFSSAHGLFARNDMRPLRPDHAFRTAIVAKPVTAATAVCLAANQSWNLDDPITKYLPSNIIRKLSKLKGLTHVNDLTIRRLLGHSRGLPDYFFDLRFQAQVKKDPNHVWQPEELVEAAVEIGELLFSPGSDFSYGDTAYVLVGIAIERLTNSTLADVYRSLIFRPLAMEATIYAINRKS